MQGGFVAKALGDIARAKGMAQVARNAGKLLRAFTRRCRVTGVPILKPS